MSFCRKITSLCLYVGKNYPYVILSKKIRVILSKNKKNATFLKKNTQKCLEIKKIYLSLYQNLGKVYKPHPENNKKELNINIININNN